MHVNVLVRVADSRFMVMSSGLAGFSVDGPRLRLQVQTSSCCEFGMQARGLIRVFSCQEYFYACRANQPSNLKPQEHQDL